MNKKQFPIKLLRNRQIIYSPTGVDLIHYLDLNNPITLIDNPRLYNHNSVEIDIKLLNGTILNYFIDSLDYYDMNTIDNH